MLKRLQKQKTEKCSSEKPSSSPNSLLQSKDLTSNITTENHDNYKPGKKKI